jgi:D-3-phosphoglycerate dehydrogenase / 2-oxoglutarate reductase
MPDILISENIEGPSIDSLGRRFDVLRLPALWRDPAGLEEHLRGSRALIVRNQTQVTDRLLTAAQHLLVVGRAGAGFDNIDVQFANSIGVVVTYAPEQNSISAAELCIGLMLALVRRIPAADFDTRQGHWNRSVFCGVELYGKTLGIIGAGKIGYLTASRAKAFGMKIVACDPLLTPDNILLSELNAELLSLDRLLERADVVSCHVPANPQTIGLLGREQFRKMKPTSYLINAARGDVVNEEDLMEALQSRWISGAALDVRASEPPRSGELELLPNVILTPHIAAFTDEAQERVSRAVCEDVARVLQGERAQNAVNGYAVPQRFAK